MLGGALLLVGCGSPDEGGGRLSKREYIAKGNERQAQAADVFRTTDGKLAATPETAGTQIAAYDRLITGFQKLEPPREWADEHGRIVTSLETMRHALLMLSRAGAGNAKLVRAQVARYSSAQADFERAVRDINASR